MHRQCNDYRGYLSIKNQKVYYNYRGNHISQEKSRPGCWTEDSTQQLNQGVKRNNTAFTQTMQQCTSSFLLHSFVRAHESISGHPVFIFIIKKTTPRHDHIHLRLLWKSNEGREYLVHHFGAIQSQRSEFHLHSWHIIKYNDDFHLKIMMWFFIL